MAYYECSSGSGGGGSTPTIICDLVGTGSDGSYDSDYVTPTRATTYLQVTFNKACQGVISCKGGTTVSGTCTKAKVNGSTTGCNDFYEFSATSGQTFRATVGSATQYQRLTIVV